jgi:hypothetical protein
MLAIDKISWMSVRTSIPVRQIYWKIPEFYHEYLNFSAKLEKVIFLDKVFGFSKYFYSLPECLLTTLSLTSLLFIAFHLHVVLVILFSKAALMKMCFQAHLKCSGF